MTASEELTPKKPHKIAKYLPKEKRLVNLIYLAYSRSQFGSKRCKIQYFMEHFSRSVGSSRGQSLQITVNVWDQIARTVTLRSHGLKHRALSACACTFISVFTYVRVQSFLCSLMCVYSHFCVHSWARTVISVFTYVRVQSFLCSLMCVYSHFCVHLCACTVISVFTHERVQSFLCLLMCVYSHFCVHLCACTVISVFTYVRV